MPHHLDITYNLRIPIAIGIIVLICLCLQRSLALLYDELLILIGNDNDYFTPF